MPLLCSFVYASKITRICLIKTCGVGFFLEQLNKSDEAMNAKILDSIALWLQVTIKNI